MPSRVSTSSSNGFGLVSLPRFQLNDGPNPGVTQINSPLMILLPDPDSSVVGSEFVTAVIPNASWTVRILGVVGGVVGAAVYVQTVPQSANVLWVAIDPALFSAGRTYRVQIFDTGNNIAAEWDFHVFDHSVSLSGPADIAEANNHIRRIAGLLGYRQRVTYSGHQYGMPGQALIELLNEAGGTLAQYRVKNTYDSARNLTSQTSVALDNNTL